MATRTPLDLTDVEREELRALVRASRTPRGLADRCKAVLLDDEGLTYAASGTKIGMREQTALKWRKRFLTDRLAGLRDRPRPGVKRSITDEQVAEVVRKTLEERPPDATHWSLRSMAAASGVSRSALTSPRVLVILQGASRVPGGLSDPGGNRARHPRRAAVPRPALKGRCGVGVAGRPAVLLQRPAGRVRRHPFHAGPL